MVDILGNTLNLGDKVAIAVSGGAGSGILRVGRIGNIPTGNQKLKIEFDQPVNSWSGRYYSHVNYHSGSIVLLERG